MRKTTFPAVLATFVVCFLFWVLLTWSFTVQELAAGAVVSLAVALFSARFFIHEKAGWFFNPLRFLKLLGYWIFLFPVELVKANVDMARRCFTGCTDINPGKKDKEGKTWYYIHWIDVTAPSGEEAGEAIKGRLEKGLKGVWE